GSDPQLKQEYVVLTAHLDHIGRGAAVGDDTIYNGAHDNATGTAVLLEVARSIATQGPQKRSIVFAAVGAEERGLLGSDFFARNPPMAGGRIVANLNMDMPLALVPMADFIAFGAQHSTLGPVAERAAAAEGFVLTPDPWPEEVFFIRSDQFSFVRQGIPAIYLDSGTTARDPAIDAKALAAAFMSKNYHQPSDDITLPIDYGTLAGLTRTNTRIVLEIANAAEAPRWNDGDFFGEKFGGH
ncbi:MAG TPA: M28 family peptidase, partial [Steroidobacteraceae bacterium]|nr:M28 family peptidase [Steroidobacteraceae bacterium]